MDYKWAKQFICRCMYSGYSAGMCVYQANPLPNCGDLIIDLLCNLNSFEHNLVKQFTSESWVCNQAITYTCTLIYMCVTSFYPADQPNEFNIIGVLLSSSTTDAVMNSNTTDIVSSSNTLTIMWNESEPGVEYRVVPDPELSPDCVAVNTSDTSYSCSGWEQGNITTVNITAFNCLDRVSGGQGSSTTQCIFNLTGTYIHSLEH